jgi:Uma2 family endonuclease
MATDLRKSRRKFDREASEPEPAWDIALLFPAQGEWSEEDYLELDTNRLVEFSDGFVEVLPMPTMVHQLILTFLFDKLRAFAAASNPKLGTTLFAGLPVRLWKKKFREPDIVFMLAEHASRLGNDFWDGADLVMEVVSDKNRPHDIKKKRIEYAKAGIPEYWIVDPKKETITVLVLKGKQKTYTEVGTFKKGQHATSKLLAGFTVNVTEALSQEP